MAEGHNWFFSQSDEGWLLPLWGKINGQSQALQPVSIPISSLTMVIKISAPSPVANSFKDQLHSISHDFVSSNLIFHQWAELLLSMCIAAGMSLVHYRGERLHPPPPLQAPLGIISHHLLGNRWHTFTDLGRGCKCWPKCADTWMWTNTETNCCVTHLVEQKQGVSSSHSQRAPSEECNEQIEQT